MNNIYVIVYILTFNYISSPFIKYHFHENNNNFTIDRTINRANSSTLGKSLNKVYPTISFEPEVIAKELVFLENSIRELQSSDIKLPNIAHKQQVIYRKLSQNPELTNLVISLLPKYNQQIATYHIEARRNFIELSKKYTLKDTLPAWKIVKPEPSQDLLSYYKKAEKSTGIEWEILAAINLVESGMGRIVGKSVANAQGPMQFLPSTWNEKGVGLNGDINNPHDSIQAAARYLVLRGGLENIKKGLWGYNNSDNYVEAILAYAQILRLDERAYKGFYHWEIHFRSLMGDIWLPVGYDQNEPLPISSYLEIFPSGLSPN
tara:strand:+ start:1110 stop:2066 length:957 start_codon:yes stop_codon:yes gene_type:complete